VQPDNSFLFYSIVILFLVGLGQIIYGAILIPIIPAVSVKIGAFCVVVLGVFFVIRAALDYINLSLRQSR